MRSDGDILIVNPNTSEAITQTIAALVGVQLGRRFALRTATADFGFQYISSRAAIAVAGHAVLDAVAKALAEGYRPDVILLACFGDPGFEALSEMCDIPVVGFAEAGLQAAAVLPGSFIVATRGDVWREVLLELAQKLGIAGKLAGVETIDHLAGDPEGIAGFLAERAQTAGASRVLIGGSGLIPRLDAIVAASRVEVLDAHRAAIAKAARFAKAPVCARPTPPAAARVSGVSSHLEQLLASGGLALPTPQR